MLVTIGLVRYQEPRVGLVRYQEPRVGRAALTVSSPVGSRAWRLAGAWWWRWWRKQ